MEETQAVTLEHVKRAAGSDRTCRSLVRAIREGFLEKKRTVGEDLRAFYSMKEELYELEEGALPTWAHADPRHAEETGSGHMGWHSAITGRTSWLGGLTCLDRTRVFISTRSLRLHRQSRIMSFIKQVHTPMQPYPKAFLMTSEPIQSSSEMDQNGQKWPFLPIWGLCIDLTSFNKHSKFLFIYSTD